MNDFKFFEVPYTWNVEAFKDGQQYKIYDAIIRYIHSERFDNKPIELCELHESICIDLVYPEVVKFEGYDYPLTDYYSEEEIDSISPDIEDSFFKWLCGDEGLTWKAYIAYLLIKNKVSFKICPVYTDTEDDLIRNLIEYNDFEELAEIINITYLEDNESLIGSQQVWDDLLFSREEV